MWFNVLNIAGWLKGGVETPVSQTDKLPVDTGLIQPTTPADTQPISAASLPLPTGAATEAKQLPDNHQVTVSNQIAQPIQDGGSVNVANQPSEYPLPAAQVAEIKPLAVQTVSGVVTGLSALVPVEYSRIELGYTGDDITTVTYKQGAATVAVLTLGYTGGKLTSVERT